MIPEPVRAYAREHGLGQITHAAPVGGGCINAGQTLTTVSGQRLFLKTNAAAPPDMFQREAEGLRALAAAPGAPRAPAPLLIGPDYLLLEFLAPSAPDPRGWETFGEQLARLHLVTQPRFGFEHDNYIGLTPQPNAWQADGYVFFAEQRLEFQSQLAGQRGRLPARASRQLQRLAARLPDLVPPQPASLLHGDLWSGNIVAGPLGQACLIDPAAYFGWAEADLAMSMLFGRLPERALQAYTALRPLALAWRERFDLYNLYHLLNHLNLFGASYLAPIEAILARFD